MSSNGAEFRSFCRQCGGERLHNVVASEARPWEDEEAPVNGCDTYAILECRGCQTVTFSHTHWFSEDTEPTKRGFEPIEHRDLYPPAPQRKMPEWGSDLWLSLRSDEQWIVWVLADVYAAAGMKSFSLASMGARAIIDYIVTDRAGERPKGESNYFADKLRRMHEQGFIAETSITEISAAWDAGSASAHRGFKPRQ